MDLDDDEFRFELLRQEMERIEKEKEMKAMEKQMEINQYEKLGAKPKRKS